MSEQPISGRGEQNPDASRGEIHELVMEAKENLGRWQRGDQEAQKGFYPFAAEIDTNRLTEEDIALWEQIKRGEATKKDFDDYDKKLEDEIRRIADPELRKEVSMTRYGFRGMATHFFENQQQ